MNKLLYLAPHTIGKFIIAENGCWLWTASKNNMGYGMVNTTLNYKPIRGLAHRILYTAFKGEIPERKSLDHLCRVRNCVNPNHLEVVTHKENMLRSPSAATALNAKKTHCVQGHKYTKANTLNRQRIGRAPERSCRTCRDMRNKARYKR